MKLSIFSTNVITQKLKSLDHRKIISGLTLVFLATAIGLALGYFVKSTNVFAQTGEIKDEKKVSIEARKTHNDQIKFSNLKVGNEAKDFENGFREQEGWIGRTSFEIENISNQNITYVEFRIRFPETKATGSIMTYVFSFGNRPAPRKQTARPFLFGKGERLTVNLAEQYQNITKFVKNGYTIESINHIDVEVGFIIFQDGTGWNLGEFMLQDPQDPTRWLPIKMPGYVPTESLDLDKENRL